MSEIMADIIAEEVAKMEAVTQAVVGIALNGVPFATYLSEYLGEDLAVYTPPAERGGGRKGKR